MICIVGLIIALIVGWVLIKPLLKRIIGGTQTTGEIVRPDEVDVPEEVLRAVSILRLRLPTSFEEVKKAYKSFVRIAHPDNFQSAEEKEKATVVMCHLGNARDTLYHYLSH